MRLVLLAFVVVVCGLSAHFLSGHTLQADREGWLIVGVLSLNCVALALHIFFPDGPPRRGLPTSNGE